MPSEVSTAGADQHLGRVVDELKRELEAKSRELAEAREQQAATAGILAAISSSPADLRRVCAEIAANAARLCDAYDALIAQVDGDSLRLVAHHGPIPTHAPVGQATLPLTRGVTFARAVLDRQTIHVPDVQAEMGEYPQSSDLARRLGIRTVLIHPLMRGDVAIGVIGIRRTEVRPFTEKQIELLKVFADQAVIAIENTRLFEEVQARTRELTELLEYQTATERGADTSSAGSPTNCPTGVRRHCPKRSASLRGSIQRGLAATMASLLHCGACHNFTPEVLDHVRKTYPKRPDRSVAAGRAILELAEISHVPDTLSGSCLTPRPTRAGRKLGELPFRSPHAARR